MAPRKNLFRVWDYFVNKRECGKAICNLCKIHIKNNRTFNLKAHLMKVHKIDIKTNESQQSSTSIVMPTISTRRQDIKVQISKKMLIRSYIGLVTEDGVPFSVLNSPNMRNIIEPLCNGLGEKLGKRFTLNINSCKRLLKKVADNIRGSMKKEINKRLISLKIDSAFGLSRNIFVISAQFIEDDEIKSLVLGVIELKDIGTSMPNNLAAEIIKILSKYDIHFNNIVSITSGNEENMIKTCNILSSFKMCEEYETRNMSEEDDSNPYVDNIENLDDPLTLSIENILICRCAAHTAQLCAIDVTKDPEIKRLLLDCRNFTKFIQDPSNGFKSAFELRKLQLPQLDSSTKWGSTYKMIQDLLAAKEVLITVDSITKQNIDENFENDESLWEFIESYDAVFAPLEEAIVKFQTEHLHYGDFYAQWLKCKMLTTKIIQQNSTHDVIKKIGNSVLESMERRTSKFLENESLNACLFLDPRFHHTLNQEKRQEAVLYLKYLWDKLCSICAPAEYISNINISMANQNKFEDEAEEMLNTFLTEKLQATSGQKVPCDVYSRIENLFLLFMRSDSDVLHYWKERKYSDPELYALSNVCFAIPSTQATNEPALSSLKLILTDNQNRMSNENLEHILLVKLNSSFLNEATNSLPLIADDNDD